MQHYVSAVHLCVVVVSNFWQLAAAIRCRTKIILPIISLCLTNTILSTNIFSKVSSELVFIMVLRTMTYGTIMLCGRWYMYIICLLLKIARFNAVAKYRMSRSSTLSSNADQVAISLDDRSAHINDQIKLKKFVDELHCKLRFFSLVPLGTFHLCASVLIWLSQNMFYLYESVLLLVFSWLVSFILPFRACIINDRILGNVMSHVFFGFQVLLCGVIVSHVMSITVCEESMVYQFAHFGIWNLMGACLLGACPVRNTSDATRNFAATLGESFQQILASQERYNRFTSYMSRKFETEHWKFWMVAHAHRYSAASALMGGDDYDIIANAIEIYTTYFHPMGMFLITDLPHKCLDQVTKDFDRYSRTIEMHPKEQVPIEIRRLASTTFNCAADNILKHIITKRLPRFLELETSAGYAGTSPSCSHYLVLRAINFVPTVARLVCTCSDTSHVRATLVKFSEAVGNAALLDHVQIPSNVLLSGHDTDDLVTSVSSQSTCSERSVCELPPAPMRYETRLSLSDLFEMYSADDGSYIPEG